MSRIAPRFKALKAEGKTALISYITAGDPAPWVTVPILHSLVDAGADILELGVPFSDPMADGPVIQKACERALKNNITMENVFDMVREFRTKDADTPIVLMGYANPIEAMGYENFAAKAQAAGVDGVLTVDFPPEEAGELLPLLKAHDIDCIFLVAPTTTEARMTMIAEHASGFIYYVSIKGVTGSAAIDVSAVAEKLEILRTKTALPLGVGFGIRDGESAAKVSTVADAVVVGSALVNCIASNTNKIENLAGMVGGILSEMRRAINVQDQQG